MTDPQDTIPLGREFVIDRNASRRLITAVWLFTLSRPLTIIVAVTVEAIAVSVLVIVGGNLGGFLLLFALLYPPAFLWDVRRKARRSINGSAPIGARFAVGLGDRAIRMDGPIVSATIKYTAYRRVLARRHIVVFQQRVGGGYGAFARELFPAAALARLRTAIPSN